MSLLKKIKVGVVTARFNNEVTYRLEAGALAEFKKAGLSSDQINAVRVAGAVEIPLAAQALLDAGCDGVVALGAVIRGETTHYDYVCASVERGCSQLALQYKKPVAFGVLTTENEEQAMDRAGGSHGNKGAESAQVTLEMIELLHSIGSGNDPKRHPEQSRVGI
ncbi:MAG: 6,7-dimethyl-8-ribityllumazine synthase [Pseudobdellovibrionaceae bacterium]